MSISAYIPQILLHLFCCCLMFLWLIFLLFFSVFGYCHYSISCLFPTAVFPVQNNVCNLYLDLLILIFAFVCLVDWLWLFCCCCLFGLFFFCYFHNSFFTVLCFKTHYFRNTSSCLYLYGCIDSVEYSSFFSFRSSKKKPVVWFQRFLCKNLIHL